MFKKSNVFEGGACMNLGDGVDRNFKAEAARAMLEELRSTLEPVPSIEAVRHECLAQDGWFDAPEIGLAMGIDDYDVWSKILGHIKTLVERGDLIKTGDVPEFESEMFAVAGSD